MRIYTQSLAIHSSADPTMSVARSIEIDDKREFVTMTMSKPCVQDVEYKLSLNYDGKLLFQYNGFYRTSYHDQNGNQV